MAAVQWHPRERRYTSELQSCRPECAPVEPGDYHPLKAITVTDAKSRRRKGEILARFTTTEKLSINLFMGTDKGKAPNPGSSAVSEKVRNRLEELDNQEEGSQRELLNLSQQEYANRIEELNQSLKEAWATDQKVKALKIVIQCSKLLSDTSVIQFYPSKFVLITDILDTFGRLVYDRIWSMYSFTADEVNDTAKETCLNWFFKIASIRELVPRLYVEAAILKCNRFLNKTGIQETLPRLTAMIRGIGDPLVAVYARAYLCRVGMEVAPQLKDSLNQNFFDLLSAFRQLHGDSVQNQLVLQRVEIPEYLTLYSPAIHWILQCVAYRAPDPLLTEMMERCKKLGNNALLLNSVMWAFKAEFVAARATDFIGMIKDCDEAGFPKHLLFGSLGRSLACADPPEAERLTILNEAWKVITKIRSPQDYIHCAEIWVEFTCRHFTKREVNTILADVIKHLTPDRAFEDAYPQLQSVIQKILTYFHDFSVLFSMERFLPFLDMFQKDSVRVEVCKTIMEVFLKHQAEPTRDPVILNALLHVCKAMHDSVNALTLEDEKRASSFLISGFIRMVWFGRDFEQQLSFCVALANQCLSQADAFFKAAVSLLPEVPRSISVEGKSRPSESFLLDFISNFFATLLVVPDHPEHGVLYLVRGVLNMVQDYTWEDNGDAKVKVYIAALPLLAAMSQETYLYSIPKVDSNETLYGGDPKFLMEINKLCETLIGQVLDYLKTLGREEQMVRRQGSLSFSLFGVLLAHGDLRNNRLNQLAVNLWNLNHKHGCSDTRTSVRTLEHMKQQAQQPGMAHMADMVQRLTLQSRT
ncbi:hypothetical protein NHX12_025089 [Muraenolepis orangiensis]|uniref:VPS35 endosomal protein-sorting factor-like n=1 Tax=Muraenolepis orangiensis TaxID=630683 RepID=A0A9Q0EJI2_9TELE|nr:hypothetical protein NHX12_025089 [Muraenolepis orangiensis]